MTPLVEVERVSKSYARVHAVRDLSLAVAPGEIFALLGPNGAGKTSLVRMLVGIMQPDSGTIRFHLDGASGPELPAEAVGYLPEERGLFRDTPVLRTLTYFGVLRGMRRKDAEGAADGWLTRLELQDRAHDRIDALSKGNQQKVQLVAAILHRPRFAILAEPFSGLDPLNQELVLELLRELVKDGTTVLLSAHQMDLVEQVADRVLLLHRGRAVLSGPLAEVRRDALCGRRIRLEVRGPCAPRALDGHADVQRTELGDGFVNLWVRDGASLGGVLGAAAELGDITSIHSAPVRLHDIFVATVGAQADGDDAAADDGAAEASP